MVKLLISLFFFLLVISAAYSLALTDPVPNPTTWPLQFHSILMTNTSKGLLQINDLWYDWPNRRKINIIQRQLGQELYGVEWDNGTSYYYTLECYTIQFEVGILRPNWLDGANYLGQAYKDGFLCNVWEKVDFIWYYEDVASKRPVFWTFYTGMTMHVMTFEVGKVLDDSIWQAPVYCFEEANKQDDNDNMTTPLLESAFGLMRDVSRIPMVI